MNRNPQIYQPASSQGTWKSWTGKDSVMGYAPVTTMDCEYVWVTFCDALQKIV